MMAALSSVTPVAVGLAGGALLLATARAVLTYRETARVLRVSAHHAVTDGLSGLGNRRRLMDDLEEAVIDPPMAMPQPSCSSISTALSATTTASGTLPVIPCSARIGAALGMAVDSRGNAYRLGGDEFCVLLTGRVARHDRLVTSAASALTERGSAFTVNASFGWRRCPMTRRAPAPRCNWLTSGCTPTRLAPAATVALKTRDVLMQLLNERTPDLHHHVNGVGQLVVDLAREFTLDSDQLDEILRAAELHDIGKLAIPDEILEKPGPLNASEWQFMRQHSIVGERILNADPALRPVARLVRASHERWDGAGYPDGLAGAAIPLGARIIAACDAYEAMTSERCYQAARSSDEAIAELRRNSGTQFDPAVIDSLCRRLTLEPGPSLVAVPLG